MNLEKLILPSRNLTDEIFDKQSLQKKNVDIPEIPILKKIEESYFVEGKEKCDNPKFCEWAQNRIEAKNSSDSIKVKLFPETIQTRDKITLNGFSAKYSGNDAKNMTIIYFPGNGVFVRTAAEEMWKMAEKFKCKVVTFDYRGVGWNEGECKNAKKLINDGIDIVKELHKNNENSKILLFGHSIGGGVATKVADFYLCNAFRKSKIDLYLINDRSFSKVSNVLGREAKHIARPILRFTRWEINAVDSYLKIPESRKMSDNLINDSVITTYASLTRKVKMKNPKDTTSIVFNDDATKLDNGIAVPNDEKSNNTAEMLAKKHIEDGIKKHSAPANKISGYVVDPSGKNSNKDIISLQDIHEHFINNKVRPPEMGI